MLRARLATAAVAIPLLLWVIFAAPFWLFETVVLSFTALSLLEYFRMAFPRRRASRWLGIAAGLAVALAIAAGATSADAAAPASASGFSAAILGIVIVGLIAMLASPEDARTTVAGLGRMLVGVLYAGALLPHLIWLRSDAGPDGSAWVLLVIALGMAGDTGGYFAGRSYGRRPLMPEVSPKKTVEGSLGGLAGSLIAGVLIKIVFLPSVALGEIVVISVISGILGQVGDLCESLLKRAFGAKDSGGLLPGHGGVLDRADSLVFPTVFIYYTMRFLYGA